MRALHVNDVIRLNRDIPELALTRGDVGVVCSLWFSPETAYEVEFERSGNASPTRTLLHVEQCDMGDESNAIDYPSNSMLHG